MVKRSKIEEIAPNVAEPVGPFVEEFVVAARFDDDGVQVSSGIGKDGKEYGDPLPMAVPLGYEPPVPLIDMMRSMIERMKAPDNEFEIDETEEEANDFETEDDRPDPLTPFEEVFVPKVPSVAPVAQVKVEVKEAAVSSPPPVVDALKPT